MQMKSKHSASGEFASNWKPPPPMLEGGEQLPALQESTTPVRPRPGWCTVHPPPDRRQRSARTVPKYIAQVPAAPTAFSYCSPYPKTTNSGLGSLETYAYPPLTASKFIDYILHPTSKSLLQHPSVDPQCFRVPRNRLAACLVLVLHLHRKRTGSAKALVNVCCTRQVLD
ncbi:hypothetical protein H2248_008007 [Termitomyces sp. 'cryptogamus']|nr:hypothetical protein H2248_008007 [Termitomyces sp. 'cryptogamus']